jgi:hypothetical protein
MLIDVGVDRLGTVAGAGLTTLIVSALSVRGVRVIVALAMCMAVAALFCAARLNRGYIEALAGRLRRAPELDPKQGFDAATHRTLAESTALDQGAILDAVERQSSRAANDAAAPGERRDQEDTVLVGPTGAGFEVAPGYVGLQLGSAASFSPVDTSREDDPLLSAIRELRSGKSDRIRPVLAAPLAPQLAVHVIPLLGFDDVARDALRALRGAAPRVVGALADALLDLESNVVVRRRIPRALERCSTARSIQALVEGLFDPELDVRSQCALALLRVVELDPNAALPRELILDAIEAELWREGPLVSASASADSLEDQPGFGAADLRERVHQGIEQVMTLLALLLEREPVRLAYHALYSEDAAIRGTALEYLDNVLPDRIRPGVLALVQGPSQVERVGERRNRAALVDELQRARERLIPPARRPPRASSG